MSGTGENRRCFHRVDVVAYAANVAVDAIGVGPIGLDRHRREVLLLDQAFRYLRPFAVEVVRAVGRLAEQRKSGAPIRSVSGS